MVAIVDDLIILGVAIAASVAASQISASAAEDSATDEAGRQRALAKRQQQMDYWINMASKHGPNAGDVGDLMRARQGRWAIEQGYQGALRAAERQADQTRLNGWLNAGSMLAGGIANAAMSPEGDRAPGLADALGGNDSLAERAGHYALNPNNYGALAAPGQRKPPPNIRPTDVPSPYVNTDGGFQLQESDYRLLGGAGPYAHSPYADDPYAVGPGFADPKRFQFRL